MKKQKEIFSLVAAIAVMGNVSLYGGSEGKTGGNVYYGDGTGSSLDAGANGGNVFMGYYTGYNTDWGRRNTFSGYQSGYSNTFGSDNTFSGYLSGYFNTDGGIANTFFGSQSGYSNTIGIWNTFLGAGSGYSNTTGWRNTFIGMGSGYNNTTGLRNTFLGVGSGYYTTTGRRNTFCGAGSGHDNTNGQRNTFCGEASGFHHTSGDYNIFVGYRSGYNADINGSVLLGYEAGYDATRDNTLYISNSDTNNSLIYGEFDTKMLRVNGVMEINSTKFLVSQADKGPIYGYPALRLNSFDLPRTQMDWIIGLRYEPEVLPTPKGALAFYNAATGKVPLRITNGAKDALLALIKSTVVVKGDLNTTGVISSYLDVNNTFTSEFAMELSRENIGTGYSDVGFTLENKTDRGGFKWALQTDYQNEGLVASKIGTNGYEFAVNNPTDNVDNVELSAAGKVFFTGGHLQDPSSRSYKDDIKTLDIKTALKAFNKLEPVTFVYKGHKEDKVVGFIAEDVPELLAMKGRKGINPTEIVAVLTKVLQEQDKVLAETRAEMKAKDKQIALLVEKQKEQSLKITQLETMKKKVAMMESILTNLTLDTSHTKQKKVSFQFLY